MKRLFAPRDTDRAREMRNQPTEAEDLLWRYLRGRRCGGAKFSRQIPVGAYFVDFLSREHGLVVEVDGAPHELTADYDGRRSAYLTEHGLRVVRFTNDEVMRNLEGVVRAIEMALLNPTLLAAQAVPPACGRDVRSPSRRREGQVREADRGGVTR